MDLDDIFGQIDGDSCRFAFRIPPSNQWSSMVFPTRQSWKSDVVLSEARGSFVS